MKHSAPPSGLKGQQQSHNMNFWFSLVLYRLSLQAGVSLAFGIWLHVHTGPRETSKFPLCWGSSSRLWNQTRLKRCLIINPVLSKSSQAWTRISNELVTRLEKDRRRDAGKKSWEGEESHFSSKHETGRKNKVRPEAFLKYKAPLIFLPNWCLCCVKAIWRLRRD